MRIFISYSHDDSAYLKNVETHPKALGLKDLDIWVDTRIAGGDEWHVEIQIAIDEADVTLMLISASFLASNFIQDEEVPQVLRQRSDNGSKVFLLVLSDCPWRHHEWLEQMRLRPQNAKNRLQPLEAMTKANRNKALSRLAEEIADFLKTAKTQTATLKTTQKFRSYFTPSFPTTPPILGREEELDWLDSLINGKVSVAYLEPFDARTFLKTHEGV